MLDKMQFNFISEIRSSGAVFKEIREIVTRANQRRTLRIVRIVQGIKYAGA